RPGLYKVPESDVESDSNNDLVGAGKPVIGSVNSVEVVSAGYIDCTPADVLIYSGAVASLIDIEVLKRIGRTDTPLRPCDTSLNGVTGHKIGAKGAIDLPLHLGSLEMDRLFVAVNRLHVDVILGRDTLKDFRAVIDLHVLRTTVAVASLVPESAFGFEMETEVPSGIDSQPTHEECPASNWVDSVLSATTNDKGDRSKAMPQLEKVSKVELEVDFNGSKLNKEQQHLLKEVLYLFRDMFVDTSMTPGRPDWAEGDVMEAELQQYLSLGHIRLSTSHWASSVRMIRKPDGGIRVSIDYRRLNAVTVKDGYPMPLIVDILDVLGNAKLFSTMDIASGYWNVPMAKASVEKTAFSCKYGLYEWLVKPFGLCNAVPAFDRLM
ncbi:hypothetical protein PHMEG_00030695, partial [Phytophthora megakarya]